MSAEMVGIIALITMLVLMMLRVPIAISMMLPAVLGIYYMRDWTVLSAAVESIVWSSAIHYSFSVIPMFLWMGEMFSTTGISSDLYSTFQKWLGRFKGGLAMATIGASAVFAAASGSSIANTATIGQMAAKEMLNNRYDKSIAGGSIVAGGTLGLLIPPSTFLIVYGMLAEQSIGNLLIASIVPGIMMSLLFIITIYIAVLVKPDLAPKGDSYSWKDRFASLKNTFWIILLFIVVIGGMFIGLFGPTEAAGMGAFCATLIAWAKKKLDWAIFTKAIYRTIRTCGFTFAIILSGFLLSYMLSISKVPLLASSFLMDAGFSPLTMFIIIVIMYVLLGTVMDALAAVVVTLPFVIPVISSMGLDLVWFGIVLCILVEMALISPPYGMNLMVLNGTVPELDLWKLFKGGIMFLIPMLIGIALLYMFPQIALWLPSLL